MIEYLVVFCTFSSFGNLTDNEEHFKA
jgi:hypothetical protein